MKIAIDIRHLSSKNPSGVGHYSRRLIEELAKLAPDDQFILFAAGRAKTLLNLPVFDFDNVTLVKKNIPNRLLYLLLKLPGGPKLESFLKEKPDVWFFPNLNIIKTNLPYALTVHDLSYKIYPEFFTQKTRLWHQVAKADKLSRASKAILAVSESTKRDLIEKLGIYDQKVTVTHLGVDAEFNTAEKPQDKNYLATYKIRYPYFITLSTIEPRKNIESTIEAYSLWRDQSDENNPPHLIIAGGRGWKSKAVDATVQSSKYAKDIHLIGYIDSRHRPALLRHAKALIFPSYYEGFGLPALEAMACGTPVITSFTGSMSEVVGDAAIMVDPYNVADIVQALETLPSVADQLRRCGRERARQFSWQETARKTLQVLKSL